MNMLPYVGFAGLFLTVAGIGFKIVWNISQLEFEVRELRKSIGLVKQVPLLSHRVRVIEHHLDIVTPHDEGLGQGEPS